MKKNHIIFTVTNDLSYDQRMKRICSTLQGEGYECLLVGRSLPGSVKLSEENFAQKRMHLIFKKSFLFYAFFNIRLFFYLIFRASKAICAIDLDTLPACWLVAKITNRKLIFDSHEYFTEVPELEEGSVQKNFWKGIARILIPRIQYAYTVNQSLAQLFSEKYGIPFEVIQNCPKSSPDKSSIEKPTGHVEELLNANKIILYQGALNQGRGLEHCILSMRNLSGCILYIAGEGDLSTELRLMVDHYELTEKVRFLGYLQPHELKQVTEIAWIGINVLDHKSLNYYYSLANKYFDYMHAGVPGISMNFPEYKRINDIRQVNLLLNSLSVETITQAINQLLKDETLYSRLKANCQILSTQFTWEKEAQKLIRFYRQIIQV